MQRRVPRVPVLILVGTFIVTASILALRPHFADATPAPSAKSGAAKTND
jgi:hypothetical protein